MRFLKSLAVFVMPLVNEAEYEDNWCQILVFLPRNRMFSTGFFKDRAPSPLYLIEHIRGATHSERMTGDIISWGDFVFNLTYKYTSRHERSQSVRKKIRPNVRKHYTTYTK